MRRLNLADISAISLSKRLLRCRSQMLHRSLPRQTRSIHSCRMRKNESKILPSQPHSRSTGLSRNRHRQTLPKLYRWTLLFTNKNALLHFNEQSSNYQRWHEELEGHSFWACEQRKERFKNKQWNKKQPKSQPHNCITAIYKKRMKISRNLDT